MSKKLIDEKLAERVVRHTNDYSKFKVMKGNREVNQKHVTQLIKLMVENGNLTDQFPIIVAKDGLVIDGQHRLEALKTLGWEVGYMVEERATIETVRAINQGNRNWSWRDIAYSYSALGNDEYGWFVDFVDEFGYGFNPMLALCAGKGARSGYRRNYAKGELKIKDKGQVLGIAKQMTDITDLLNNDNSELLYALMAIMRSPVYDHDRMLKKLEQQADTIPTRGLQADYKRRLEEIYNFGYPEENKVRLF